jgi:hypothetical protein
MHAGAKTRPRRHPEEIAEGVAGEAEASTPPEQHVKVTLSRSPRILAKRLAMATSGLPATRCRAKCRSCGRSPQAAGASVPRGGHLTPAGSKSGDGDRRNMADAAKVLAEAQRSILPAGRMS